MNALLAGICIGIFIILLPSALLVGYWMHHAVTPADMLVIDGEVSDQ